MIFSTECLLSPIKDALQEVGSAVYGLILFICYKCSIPDQHLEENKAQQILLRRDFQVIPHVSFSLFFHLYSVSTFWLKRYHTGPQADPQIVSSPEYCLSSNRVLIIFFIWEKTNLLCSEKAVRFQMISCRWRDYGQIHVSKLKSEPTKKMIFSDIQKTWHSHMGSEIEHTVFLPNNWKIKESKDMKKRSQGQLKSRSDLQGEEDHLLWKLSPSYLLMTSLDFTVLRRDLSRN